MAEEENFDISLSIPGEVAQVIHLAIKEFANKNLDITGYEVLVSESPSSYEIVFQHASAPQGLRGAQKGHPGLAVRIRKKSHEIIKVYFIR